MHALSATPARVRGRASVKGVRRFRTLHDSLCQDSLSQERRGVASCRVVVRLRGETKRSSTLLPSGVLVSEDQA
jgi:hypothetical protein